MYRGALVSGFVNVLVCFNKSAIWNHSIDFFKQLKILEINRRFVWLLSFKIIDILWSSKIDLQFANFFVPNFLLQMRAPD